MWVQFQHLHLIEQIRTDRMFLFSKLLSAITQPMFWLAIWWALALLILMR